MVVEVIPVEDIFELVALALSLIMSWTFRILAHEEDQYTDFLSIALKQTKAGPRSSGTSSLVFVMNEKCRSTFINYKLDKRKVLPVLLQIFI